MINFIDPLFDLCGGLVNKFNEIKCTIHIGCCIGDHNAVASL